MFIFYFLVFKLHQDVASTKGILRINLDQNSDYPDGEKQNKNLKGWKRDFCGCNKKDRGKVEFIKHSSDAHENYEMY